MKKISIVIPTYNSEKTLKRCINSILNQSYKNIEIIIIDDGSTDQTEEVIISNYSSLENLIFIKQSNSGVSSARNRGIECATGDYVFFIDSDDTIDQYVLQNLISNINNSSLMGVSHALCKSGKKYINLYEKESYLKNELIEEILKGNIMGTVWGYLFKSDLIKKCKFDTNTMYLEDTLFLIDYIQKSKIENITYIKGENYYNYFIHDDSITATSKNIFSKCQNIIYSLDKINELTNRRYKGLIENKKIILLEKEMRLINSKSEYLLIMKNIEIQSKYNNSIINKLFLFIYYTRNASLMRLYYFLRRNIKIIMNMRGNNV